MQLRDWTDRDGSRRRSAEVLAERIYFGGGRREDAPKRTTSGPGQGYSEEDSPPDSGRQEMETPEGEPPF